ncbi:hypothetical protein, partial [Bacillus pumilus]|uniref:hypothetical protein n=1 Tax=Bacillus pumilus TaxID=1408 RepID=UPI0011A61E0F
MIVMMSGMKVTGGGNKGRRCKCVRWMGRGASGGRGGLGILKGEWVRVDGSVGGWCGMLMVGYWKVGRRINEIIGERKMVRRGGSLNWEVIVKNKRRGMRRMSERIIVGMRLQWARFRASKFAVVRA